MTPAAMKTTICLTGRCNLGCAHCFREADGGADISVQDLTRSIELAFESARDGARPLAFSFFGGEPLLRPDLVDLGSRRIRELEAGLGRPRAGISVTTNGTLLDDGMLALLRERAIDLCVSVDGPPDLHDARRPMRSGGGSSRVVYENLRRAVDALDRVQVNVVYAPESLPRLAGTVASLFELGVAAIHLNLDLAADWSGTSPEVMAEAFSGVAAKYAELLLAGEDVALNPLDSKMCLVLSGGHGPDDICGIGKPQWAVGVNGTLYPCERLMVPAAALPWRLGDLDSLTELQGELVRRAVRAPRNPECGECGLRAHCVHWCACTNHRLTGKRDVVAAVTCSTEKAAIRAAIQLIREAARNGPEVLQRHLSRYHRNACVGEDPQSLEGG